jgi:hypothetical protein
MNILEVCPSIRLCRVLESVRLGRSVTEGPFPKIKQNVLDARSKLQGVGGNITLEAGKNMQDGAMRMEKWDA